MNVLINGDAPDDANGNAAEVVKTAEAGKLSYDDLLALWGRFSDFQMNTLIASPDMMQKLLILTELRDPVFPGSTSPAAA